MLRGRHVRSGQAPVQQRVKLCSPGIDTRPPGRVPGGCGQRQESQQHTDMEGGNWHTSKKKKTSFDSGKHSFWYIKWLQKGLLQFCRQGVNNLLIRHLNCLVRDLNRRACVYFIRLNIVLHGIESICVSKLYIIIWRQKDAY